MLENRMFRIRQLLIFTGRIAPINYQFSEILECIWYDGLTDLEFSFKEVLDRLR